MSSKNIGATILAVQVLKHPNFGNSAHVQNDPRILKAGLYAGKHRDNQVIEPFCRSKADCFVSVAIASNTGALTSLPSSLAGLLWRRILSEKGTAFLVIDICLFRVSNCTCDCHRDPHKSESVQSDQSGPRFSDNLCRS